MATYTTTVILEKFYSTILEKSQVEVKVSKYSNELHDFVLEIGWWARSPEGFDVPASAEHVNHVTSNYQKCIFHQHSVYSAKFAW